MFYPGDPNTTKTILTLNMTPTGNKIVVREGFAEGWLDMDVQVLEGGYSEIKENSPAGFERKTISFVVGKPALKEFCRVLLIELANK